MKKILTLTLFVVFSLCFLISACSAPKSDATVQPSAVMSEQPSTVMSEQPSMAVTEGADSRTWIPSDVTGSVTSDMKLSKKNDYHAAVNQEWMSTAKIPDGQTQIGSLTENETEIKKQILALIADKSQTSHEAKLTQKFYNDFVDIETRNKLGVQPIIPQINAIKEISSMEELTEYYKMDYQLISPPVAIIANPDFNDSTKYTIIIQGPACSLDNADEYRELSDVGTRKKQAVTLVFGTMLERVGYSKAESENIIEQMFAMETKINLQAGGMQNQESTERYAESNNPVTIDTLKEMNPVFPIVQLLQPYMDLGVERYLNAEPGWLADMNKLYVEENLEGFKAILLYQVINGSLMYLDQEALDLEAQKQSIIMDSEIKLNLEDKAYEYTNNFLSMVIGKLYVENYVSPEIKNEIQGIIDEVVGVYRNRLSKIDWLSEDAREKAIEKLDALKFMVAYPDDWTPYDRSDLILEETNTILDDVIKIYEYETENLRQRAAKPVNKDLWQMPPQMVNAAYSPQGNVIAIMSGILLGDFYDKNNSLEENMGAIGTVIAHEITHAFDPMGSQFDKDGNLSSWWTAEDQAAFDVRAAKVSKYFGGIEVLPGNYANGKSTLGETVADLGAVSCILEIVKEKEGFDYDAFFESYSKSCKKQKLKSLVEEDLQTNPHLPGYLRINGIIQQFPEFYDAIGVQEGDGMYLPLEERLSIW